VGGLISFRVAYCWRDWSFTAPTDLVDQTFIVFVDDRRGQEMSTTMTVDRKGLSLAGYVDEVMREVTTRVKNARLQERSDTMVGGRATIIIEQLIKPTTGEPTLQRQAFVDDGDDVVVVSVTSHPHAAERIRMGLNTLLQTLHKREP
jgi:hypothetical protein